MRSTLSTERLAGGPGGAFDPCRRRVEAVERG